jgi:hypothetical protein
MDCIITGIMRTSQMIQVERVIGDRGADGGKTVNNMGEQGLVPAPIRAVTVAEE